MNIIKRDIKVVNIAFTYEEWLALHLLKMKHNKYIHTIVKEALSDNYPDFKKAHLQSQIEKQSKQGETLEFTLPTVDRQGG